MSESHEAAAYRGPDIPQPLGEQLQVALGLDARPHTFSDWVEAMATIVDRNEIAFDLDMLCTTDDSAHRAMFNGETQHYQCTQDAFIVPFLADDVDTVELETESPRSGERISITVTESGIDVDPSEAVMSFGVATNVDGPAGDGPSPAFAYGRICPYGNAFVSRAAYKQWAADVDAFTMAVSMEDTLELARALGQVI